MEQIIEKQTSEHYYWGQNCESWALVNTSELSVKQEIMPPQTKETIHFHSKAQQFFYLLNGVATFYINQIPQTVQATQGIYIKPNTQHYIANETNQLLEFLVISQPNITNDRTEV